MMPMLRLLSTAVLLAGTAGLRAQTTSAPNTGPSIVEPGAPGHPDKVLTPATDIPASRPPSAADIAFMSGMIHHHNQAVEMTALIDSHTQNPDVRRIGERIKISQTDEMRFMRDWLADRGVATPAPNGAMHRDMGNMAGMDHSQMADMDHGSMDHGSMAGMEADAMPTMPGMLTPAQMTALRAAHGAEFDHLFLTGMIQHHTGALTMVKDLLNNPGAAQDGRLFDFASDVDNTQLAEIDFMKAMLAKEKQ